MRMARLPNAAKVGKGEYPERQTMVSAFQRSGQFCSGGIGPNRYVAINLWLGARSSCDEQCSSSSAFIHAMSACSISPRWAPVR